MYKYKIVFEKSYANRCVSKKTTKEIILESSLNHQNQKDELNNLAFSVLVSNHPEFINNIDEKFATGWTQPQIKDIQLVNNYKL